MKFKKQPWIHQLQAVEKASLIPDYALFFEQGTGKTATCINMIRDKSNQYGQLLRTLIFTLPLPIKQWKEEWIDNSTVDPRNIVLLYGPQPKRVKEFLKHAYDNVGNKRACIVVTNHEALLMKDLFTEFLKWEAQAIGIDESHKFKSHASKRSKNAFDLANPFDYKTRKRKIKPNTYILSGTPYLNSPADLFQQFKILDGGETFGLSFFEFKKRYFRDRNAGMPKDRYFPNWEPCTLALDGFDAVAAIKAKIAPKSMRVLKKDCLDLPPLVNVVYKSGMTNEQKRLYAELKKDLVTYYDSKQCVVNLAITKALRLLQITSGFIATETPGEGEDSKILHSLADTPKEAHLEELLREICVEQKQKVLVWSVFKENYKLIARVFKKLEIGMVEVHGGVSEVNKRRNVDAFQNDPAIQGFSGHPLSGGVGLNLTVAPYSIVYSRNFSLEQYLQPAARNHRGGSKEAGHEKITHYHLICEGTIDEVALQKLANKQDMSDKLLADLINELRGQP